MARCLNVLLALTVMIGATTVLGSVSSGGSHTASLVARAAPIGTDAFYRIWTRTDQPVAEQIVPRTWMWGPEGYTGVIAEPYLDAPGGQRTVQYFDKSRMEINDPSADLNSLWYVTNGLLAKELVTGQRQIGDRTFEADAPAQINVAGDENDHGGPTYATFNGLMGRQPNPSDSLITEIVIRSGQIGRADGLAEHGVTALDVGAPTNHAVASVFWDFMTSTGLVYELGQYTNAPLFQNPFYATGYPITEPYWAKVLVGGVTTWVLVQVFERRVLTYTPSNPEGWQVEAGNVGQHYYQWRYSTGLAPQVYVVNVDGSGLARLTYLPYGSGEPVWSADGTKILFLGYNPIGHILAGDVWIMNTDGSDATNLTHSPGDTENDLTVAPDGARIAFSRNYSSIEVLDLDNHTEKSVAMGQGPVWSPDGSRIAFVAEVTIDNVGYLALRVVNADGSNEITISTNGSPASWSADRTRLVFDAFVDEDAEIIIANADGSGSTPLTDTPENELFPAWSPDGSRIAYVHYPAGAIPGQQSFLHIMNADGSGDMRITEIDPFSMWNGARPVWSPDSTRIAVIGSDGRPQVVHADGSGVTSLVDAALNLVESKPRLSWSPDGTRIVFAAQR